MNARRLAEIRARLEKATPGPWELQYGGRIGTAGARYGSKLNGMHVADVRGWGYLTGRGACAMPGDDAAAIQDANGAFIAAAPTDIHDLLVTVEKLTAALRGAPLREHGPDCDYYDGRACDCGAEAWNTSARAALEEP